MLGKRGRRKTSDAQVETIYKKAKQEMACKDCGNVEMVDGDTAFLICSTCTQKTVIALEEKEVKINMIEKEARAKRREELKLARSGPKSEGSGKGFPRGWHFKERFEAPDGSVWCYGKSYVEGMKIENPRKKNDDNEGYIVIDESNDVISDS